MMNCLQGSSLLMVWSLQFVALNAAIHAAEDWPQWRGPARNGEVTAPPKLSATSTFQEQWRTNVHTGFSSMVISDGRLFTMGNLDDHDIVWALDVQTGEVLWKHSYACPLDPNLFEGGPTATPTVAHGRLYTLSRRGDLFCFDVATGDMKWQTHLKDDHALNVPTWGFSGSPLVLGDRLIVNAGSAGACFHATSGEVLWLSSNDDDAGYSTPLPVQVNEQTLVLMMSAKALNAVAPEDGALRWSIRWITRYGINASDPVLVNEQQLLVSSGYNKGTALIQFDAASAEQLWRSRDLANQLSPGIFRDGYLYSVSGDAGDEPTLVCFNAESGELAWSDDRFGSGSLLGCGKFIFVLSEQGKLSLMEPSTEKLRVVASQQVVDGKCWTPMAFANSCLFIRNANGVLVCTKVE